MDDTPVGEFTQKDVASRLKIEWTNYLIYESPEGSPAPTAGRLKAIADVLDVHPRELVYVDGKPQLVHHREWSGNTQADIVRGLAASGHKISQGTYSRIENGDVSLPEPAITALAKLIHLEPTDLRPLIMPPTLRQLRLWAKCNFDQVEDELLTKRVAGSGHYQEIENGTKPLGQATAKVLAELFDLDPATIWAAAKGT